MFRRLRPLPSDAVIFVFLAMALLK